MLLLVNIKQNKKNHRVIFVFQSFCNISRFNNVLIIVPIYITI